MEQTLFIAKEVDLYKIPPRAGRGHISGEWRTDDKIATQRCRVVAHGDELSVRLDDPATNEVFGVCPVPHGQRDTAVEAAVDSSRNFVLKLVDPDSGRHAFLGMNFAERAAAFDFNVALSDFERTLQRQEDLKRAAVMAVVGGESGGTAAVPGPSTAGGGGGPPPEAAALYRKEDLRLKEGESIRIAIKKNTHPNAGPSSNSGFLSKLEGVPGGSAALLAPPPRGSGAGILSPAPGSITKPSLPNTTATPPADAFGAFSFQGLQPSAAKPVAEETKPHDNAAAKEVAATQEGWATF